MQRRVTSRGDIDKWSKLAETSKGECMLWKTPQEAGILHAGPIGEVKYLCV